MGYITELLSHRASRVWGAAHYVGFGIGHNPFLDGLPSIQKQESSDRYPITATAGLIRPVLVASFYAHSSTIRVPF